MNAYNSLNNLYVLKHERTQILFLRYTFDNRSIIFDIKANNTKLVSKPYLWKIL